MLDSIRSFVSSDTDPDEPTTREYDPDDITDVEAATDPHDWSDPQRDGVSGWLQARARTIVSLGVLILIAAGLVASYASRLASAILSDPLFQGAVGVATLAAVSYTVGARHTLGRVQRIDTLCVLEGDSVTRYQGRFETAGTDDTVFVVYSGFRTFPIPHSPRPLENRELGETMVAAMRSWKGLGPEDPAIIGLGNAVVETAATNTGTVGVVLTDGLEPHPEGTASSLYAAPPSLADQEQIQQLSSKLAEATDTVAREQRERRRLQREVDRLRGLLEHRRDDYLDDFSRRLRTVTDAVQPADNDSDDESELDKARREVKDALGDVRNGGGKR